MEIRPTRDSERQGRLIDSTNRPRWRGRSKKAISNGPSAGNGRRGLRNKPPAIITCGSVDDGKSTLIGRLLINSKLVFEDQLSHSRSKESRCMGPGKKSTRIVGRRARSRARTRHYNRVAYRFFTTPQRSFIVADTPGHEQYTSNMATGASKANLAVILIDARKGVLIQTRRHSLICSLLGIRHVAPRDQ